MCYLSRIQWKKTGSRIEITSLYEPFEAIATFRVIRSKFLTKHRHRDLKFSENILLKVVKVFLKLLKIFPCYSLSYYSY